MNGHLWRRIAAALLMALVVADTMAASPRRTNFDHLLTGFPLTAAHAIAPCESCHVGGRFRGTPTACATCHSAGSRIAETVKPMRHVPTNDACELCHRSAATWGGARYPHTMVTPGACMTCHNNVTAAGKPATHLPTNTSCDLCHRTLAWLPSRYNHNNVAPGSCGSCHNGTTATGKSSGHFGTSLSCDACHRTSGWTPVLAYAHTTPYYRQHNSSVTCRSCHTTNTDVATWSASAYKPDCAGCHAARFKPDSHKKVDSPTVLYTVSDLRDCAGSCHLYNSTGAIVQTRSGHHRSTDGGF